MRTLLWTGYLHQWAARLATPLLSLDYTLAPAAAHPAQAEQLLYLYCWALANPRLLGWTGQYIVLGTNHPIHHIFSIKPISIKI